MTDDGGGQRAEPEEGYQLLQFSQRYQQGGGDDEVHFPVYTGLGNHDLDQDGPKDEVDWYRRELRDYVELNHRPGVFLKPIVPADNYDVASDCYSWNWDGLHLVQLHRFGGDTKKGAISSLGWLASDLSQHAAGGRPVVLFQHYGWDAFSVERWDPSRSHLRRERTRPAALVERGAARGAARYGQAVQRCWHIPRPRARCADDLQSRRLRSLQTEGGFHGRLRSRPRD